MGFSRKEYWSELPSLLQEIFLTQGSNLGLLHGWQILYHLNHQGSRIRKEEAAQETKKGLSEGGENREQEVVKKPEQTMLEKEGKCC